MIAVAFAINKGGTGKTLSALATALFLSRERRTLLLDLDPQANATEFLVDNPRGLTVLDAIRDLDAAIIPHSDMLDVIPCHYSFTSRAIAEFYHWEHPPIGWEATGPALRDEIARRGYQALVIDSPPSLDVQTELALAIARHVVVVVSPTTWSMTGFYPIRDLLRSINDAGRCGSPAAQPFTAGQIAGILITRFDRRTARSRVNVEQMATEFSGHARLFRTVIPTNVALDEAAYARDPAALVSGRSAGSRAYAAFARELLDRLRED